MKWCKHMANASEGKTLSTLFREYGLIGEARYWRLVQELTKQHEKGVKNYYLSLETIRRSICVRSATDARHFLDLLATCSGMVVNYNGNDCEIKYDKIAELQDNHTNNLQATCKQIREDKIREDKSILQTSKVEKLSRPEDDAHMKIFEVWNNNAKEMLPRCENISAKRLNAAKARWKNKAWREGFECAILKIYQSDFCCGLVDSKNSSGAWRASIDWFLKPDTVFKVNEGLYDNKKKITNIGNK